MRVIIATPLYPPEPGGPATYAKLLEEGLPAYGIEPVVVKFSEVRHLPKLIRHGVYFFKLAKLIKNADAVYALDPVSVGVPALISARLFNKKFFVKIVGDYAWEQGRQRFGVTENLDAFLRRTSVPFFIKILRIIQTFVARSATQVIVPSVYLKEVVSLWGIPQQKIEVIHNAVTIPENISTKEKTKGEFLIVSSGRRVPWKGFEMIERVGERKKDEGWVVRIISDVSREEALAWVNTADVFVLNSTYEGFPHALVEAMMLSTPIVATNNQGNAELVKDDGLLVPIGDEEALFGALRDIEQNRKAAQERAGRGKERMKLYDANTMLSATASLLKKIS